MAPSLQRRLSEWEAPTHVYRLKTRPPAAAMRASTAACGAVLLALAGVAAAQQPVNLTSAALDVWEELPTTCAAPARAVEPDRLADFTTLILSWQDYVKQAREGAAAGAGLWGQQGRPAEAPCAVATSSVARRSGAPAP